MMSMVGAAMALDTAAVPVLAHAWGNRHRWLIFGTFGNAVLRGQC
jgi:hypothetical protein